MESGIEVMEEKGRVRVLMPKSAPTRPWAVEWVWVAALVCLLSVGVLLALEAKQPRAEGVWVAGVGTVALLLFAVKRGMAVGQVGPMFFRTRVELVIDRRGVGQRGCGPLCWWRVKLARACVVVVCPPLRGWSEVGETSAWATVRVVGKPWWGTVWGAYEREVALEAALIVMQQVERIRRMVGVEGPALVMRDEIGVAVVEERAEGMLDLCRVPVERGAEGVRVEVAAWSREKGPGEHEAFLSNVNGVMFFAIGMGVMLIGGCLGALIGEGIGKGQGVLNVVGIVVAIGSIVGGFAWMFGAMLVRVTYDIGGGGVERITRLYGMEWKRRWGREEIEGVFLRRARLGGGRVWAVGIRTRGGKEVEFAQGWHWGARAFAEVLERELGMGEAVGGDHVGDGSG